jgi:hypothetical protein
MQIKTEVGRNNTVGLDQGRVVIDGLNLGWDSTAQPDLDRDVTAGPSLSSQI